MTESIEFICPKCGKVQPTIIYYSFPAQADCPKCERRIESNQKFHFLSEEEGKKLRPEFYKNKGK